MEREREVCFWDTLFIPRCLSTGPRRLFIVFHTFKVYSLYTCSGASIKRCQLLKTFSHLSRFPAVNRDRARERESDMGSERGKEEREREGERGREGEREKKVRRGELME